MNCYVCDQQVGFEYRVNGLGEYYCNDDCYEKDTTLSERSPSDVDHPYIDTYAMVRKDYLIWNSKWETKLDQTNMEYIEKMNDLWETMNSFIYDHLTFYMNEGDDGVFAFEIYQYLRKFEELQQKILEWRPYRETFHNVYLLFQQGYLQEKIMNGINYSEAVLIVEKFIRENHKDSEDVLLNLLGEGYSEEDYYVPDTDDFVMIFSSIEEAKHAQKAFQDVFNNEEIEVVIEKAHLCDCGCGIYVGEGNVNGDLVEKGWWFLESCGWSRVDVYL